MREEDTVARVGGDEFIIALWQITDSADVSTVAQKLVDVVSRPYVIENHSVSVTTSAGVSIYPAHGQHVESLMKSADTALYEAKSSGKNAYRISRQTQLSAVS